MIAALARTSPALLLALALAACSASDPAKPGDSGEAPGDGATENSDVPVFTHKMMKRTEENMFAALAYECPECSFEQHEAIEPPEGWTKGPTQVALFSSGELRSTPSFEGVPDAMDFVPEVPGEEYGLIAKNLDGEIIESGSGGLAVQVQVMRDTLLRFDTGMLVHELTDPDGNVFVLFAHEVDPTDTVIPDFQDASALGDFSAPGGWEYATRILEEELLLDTPDTATVLAIRNGTDSTWEMR